MAKYQISFTEDALEDLKWFKKNEQNEIRDGIKEKLANEPTVQTRNRKRLRPNETAEWELRIGKFRVFYDVDEVLHIVELKPLPRKKAIRFSFKARSKRYEYDYSS